MSDSNDDGGCGGCILIIAIIMMLIMMSEGWNKMEQDIASLDERVTAIEQQQVDTPGER